MEHDHDTVVLVEQGVGMVHSSKFIRAYNSKPTWGVGLRPRLLSGELVLRHADGKLTRGSAFSTSREPAAIFSQVRAMQTATT